MRMPDENAALAWCAGRFGADGRGFFEAPFEFPEQDLAVLADETFNGKNLIKPGGLRHSGSYFEEPYRLCVASNS